MALGQVGRNVAAGMTGGLGYFFDEEGEPKTLPLLALLADVIGHCVPMLLNSGSGCTSDCILRRTC